MTNTDIGNTELGTLRAIWRALRSGPISDHPRLLDAEGKLKTISDGEVVSELGLALKEIDIDFEKDRARSALRLARETLDEVKGLTEYEDEKATRLLTIVSFLAALAGLLFTSFSSEYPFWQTLNAVFDGWKYWFIIFTYAVFGAFTFSVVCGALVVFHATQIRFKYPQIKAQASGGSPKSYLFYKEILAVRPKDWASSFVVPASPKVNELSPELEAGYFRSYISESYLVAAKVADKLQYLQPGQKLLALSIKFLFLWLLLAAIVLICFGDPANLIPG